MKNDKRAEVKINERDLTDIIVYSEEFGKRQAVKTICKILLPILSAEQCDKLEAFMQCALTMKPIEDNTLYGKKTQEIADFIKNAGNDAFSKALLFDQVYRFNRADIRRKDGEVQMFTVKLDGETERLRNAARYSPLSSERSERARKLIQIAQTKSTIEEQVRKLESLLNQV